VDVHSILQCIYTCAADDVQIVLWERLAILIYIDICITVWVITVEYITMETDVDDIEDEEKLWKITENLVRIYFLIFCQMIMRLKNRCW
jgi:hypothetical protein